MTLSPKIAAALDARSEAGAFPGDVTVTEGPYRLSLRLTAVGPVGLAFDTLDFAVTDHPVWTTEALRTWGDRLAARLTYLMEPLVVLEVDALGGEVELKSQAPTVRGGHRAYYEVRLSQQGTLRLGRIAYDEAERKRRPTPCQMTREMIERLADDLVASVP
jgi:hypothetical protein